ncbi:peroxiredoxin-like family protein [Methyloceanibacter caenitepidi]|uniref:Thioredoxin domain-containing protein n=1 Tax=Methyloceanibacter caenitepidi TaxID=1384459 RepID=A0A0A8K776_9HYPH|nr:peroxiredoxin-like family protein [Methyloceanibacter caenitepidi]BAQ18661.1 hypothetical protein GL4_3230 [Methyloceanibacter caenitepidi]
MPETQFETLEDAFAYCRDLDASLAERLRLFSDASRALHPEGQDVVDGLAERLRASDAWAAAPAPGDLMPKFALPDETGHIVRLDDLLESGPAAITFHRGHWCPYCRISTRALAEVQDQIASEGASIVAITPEREAYGARLKSDSGIRYPVLADVDNGYALSIGLAIFVGAQVEAVMRQAGRDLPSYQGNDGWLLPIPATFVVAQNRQVVTRFIDPDYRRRMAVDDLLRALNLARSRGA